jgi:hypothetical protein
LEHSPNEAGNQPGLPAISLCDIEKFRRVDLNLGANYAETSAHAPAIPLVPGIGLWQTLTTI